jgi:3-hydroxyisobutyrate dehydrogenase-like beta-hydroxyacid dehydrogenase
MLTKIVEQVMGKKHMFLGEVGAGANMKLVRPLLRVFTSEFVDF